MPYACSIWMLIFYGMLVKRLKRYTTTLQVLGCCFLGCVCVFVCAAVKKSQRATVKIVGKTGEHEEMAEIYR